MFSQNRRIVNGRSVNEDLVRNDRLPRERVACVHLRFTSDRLTCTICKHVRLSTFLRRQDCRTTGTHLQFRGVKSQRFSMQRYDCWSKEQGGGCRKSDNDYPIAMLLHRLILSISTLFMKTFELVRNKSNQMLSSYFIFLPVKSATLEKTRVKNYILSIVVNDKTNRDLTIIVSYKFSGYRLKIPWKKCDFWGIY